MAINLFVDNDVILKLAQYGILEKLTELFGSKGEQPTIFVLETAQYKLLPKRNRYELCKTEEAALQIYTFLNEATKLAPNDVDLEILELLNTAPGIDSGEALLFAAVAKCGNNRMLTGDKRALAGLMEQDQSQVAPRFTDKLITLEALIQGFVELDLAAVQGCIRKNPDVDKALSNVFGVSAPAQEESIRAGLSSYIGHTKRSVGSLLNGGPPFY
jgi:hypothetical protein